MRFAAQFGAISWLLALWSPAAIADVIILEFEEPSFVIEEDPSGTGRAGADGNAQGDDRRDQTTIAGFGQSLNLPGSLELFVTIERGGVADLALLDTVSGGGDIQDSAAAPVDEPSSGSADGSSASAVQDSVPSARSNCSNGVCRNPLDDGEGAAFSFDFSNFTGGVSLQRIDILDLADESTGDTPAVGLFEVIKSRMADSDRYDGASPVTRRGAGDDDAASRLDLQNFFSGNVGGSRYEIEIDGPGAMIRDVVYARR